MPNPVTASLIRTSTHQLRMRSWYQWPTPVRSLPTPRAGHRIDPCEKRAAGSFAAPLHPPLAFVARVACCTGRRRVRQTERLVVVCQYRCRIGWMLHLNHGPTVLLERRPVAGLGGAFGGGIRVASTARKDKNDTTYQTGNKNRPTVRKQLLHLTTHIPSRQRQENG